MSHYNSFIELLRVILSHGGYWIILVVSIAEALPLIGSFVPGHTIVFFAGFLARLGVLNLWYVIIIASIGAIVGDIIGYELGKKYGYTFLEKHGHRFFIKKEHIEKAKQFMHNHTGKAMIFGRFHPLVRAFTPYLAGAGEVHPKKFWIFNVIGGITWAGVSVLVGYVFGASYEVVSKYIGKFLFIAIILSILIIWGYRYINARRHIFAKYHLVTLTFNIASLYVFIKMLEDSFSFESALAPLDVWFNATMISLHSVWATSSLVFITDLFSPRNIIIFSILLAIALAYKKRWYHFSILIMSLGLAGAGMTFVKYLVERVRPENSLIIETGFSFPSGHAVMALVFFSVLFYIFYKDIANKYIRECAGALAIGMFLLVGFSRLYLNVHWFTDVIGGFALGVFILSGLVLLFRIGSTDS